MLPVNAGGTGSAAIGANAVVVGDSAGGSLLSVPPGTANNALLSNGTVWASSAIASLGALTSLSAAPYAAGNTSTALTLDWNNGYVQGCTATGNVTFTLSHPVTGTTYQINITQDATGSRTYTWPAAVKWPGGSAPTGSGASKVDIIYLYWNGTNYFGTSSLNY